MALALLPGREHAECPKCEHERVFKRYTTAQAAILDMHRLRHHVHPTAETISHKSSTSL